jgi:hypothetical protein
MTTGIARLVLSCLLTGRCAFGVVALWQPRPTTSRRLHRSRLASGSVSTSQAAARAMLPVVAGWLRNAGNRNR